MVRTGPKIHRKSLLKIWQNKQSPLSFPEIIELAHQRLNLEKRTVINYLNYLVAEKILEKTVDSNRKTYYKPKDMKALSQAFLEDLTSSLNAKDLEKLCVFARTLDSVDASTKKWCNNLSGNLK
jgi:predicted transcriptional regulator